MKTCILSVVALALSATAYGGVLLDTGPGNGTTSRGSSNGPGQGVAVGADTTLTQFGFYMDTPGGGNLNFMIWDGTNSNLLFSQTVAASTTNTIGLVLSDPFSFNLTAGNTYYFGVVSDTAENVDYFFPTINSTQNSLSLVNPNTNYTGFANPTFQNSAGATIALQLVGDQVPEPSTVALMGAGLIGVFAGRRKLVRR